jgi:hypothetical protein
MLASCAKTNMFFALCPQGFLGDEKHIVFECPALQDLHDRHDNSIQALQGDAVVLLMLQDESWVTLLMLLCLLTHDHDIRGVCTSAGPSEGASDQPRVG